MTQFVHREGLWVAVLKRGTSKLCQVVNCRGHKTVRTDLDGIKTRPFCNKCRTRLFRLNNPITYILQRLRRRANKKRVPFGLTPEYMADFLAGTGYLEGRGRGNDDLQIDRIEIRLGYVPGNIQIITGLENRKKEHEYDYAGSL